MGIAGQVGGVVARTLLGKDQAIRAVVRNAEKGRPWAARGCDVAVADIFDAETLTRAFAGAEGVFLMTPPNYDPAPGFPETQKTIAAVTAAIRAARPGKVVFLSTVGAHVSEPMLLNNSKMTEEALPHMPLPVCFMRAAWFMENAAWDVDAARSGAVPSFLQPLDHPIATRDIGRFAADLLTETWSGVKIVELEGPRRYSTQDMAAALKAALGHDVRLAPVPRHTCEALFRAHRQAYGVEPICKVLPMAPSTYRTPVAKRVDPAKLGARKVWWQLRRERIDGARGAVERLMRDLGLQRVIRGKPASRVNTSIGSLGCWRFPEDGSEHNPIKRHVTPRP